MNSWLCLITRLPTANTNARMRAWRALKTAGAAVLRDGVYLLPEQPACRAALDGIAAELNAAAGTALVLRVEEPPEQDFAALFARAPEYAAVLDAVRSSHQALGPATAPALQKQASKLRRAWAGIAATDFFGCEAGKQTDAALQALEQAIARTLAPDEPHAGTGALARLDPRAYQGKTWATRQRPWVDRLACAWLIRSQIDPKARFVWLQDSRQCPREAIGFDFDGARFSHVGARVTFEVLLASFGLETPALLRIGQLVHFLDVGGVQPAEASGVESVLSGMRDALADDDQLLQAAGAVFAGLLHAFAAEERPRAAP